MDGDVSIVDVTTIENIQSNIEQNEEDNDKVQRLIVYFS